MEKTTLIWRPAKADKAAVLAYGRLVSTRSLSFLIIAFVNFPDCEAGETASQKPAEATTKGLSAMLQCEFPSEPRNVRCASRRLKPSERLPVDIGSNASTTLR